MVKPVRVILPLLLVLVASLSGAAAASASSPPLPRSMAALGDSITRAYDVCCWYGDHPGQSWSTGSTAYDGVTSHYERIRALQPAITGHASNDAVSGARAANLATQVAAAVSQHPDYVTLLIGANDLCTSSPSTMTSTATFTAQVSSALATLHSQLPRARIYVSSIPNIYQLYTVLKGNWVAQYVWSTAHICQSMLSSSNTEADRQLVVAREAAFNQALASACQQYTHCRWDGYATYHYAFSASQVSTLDYFHPSLSGQAALARVTWATSWWGA